MAYVVMAVYTEREEAIRLISARKAANEERTGNARRNTHTNFWG